MIGLLDRIRFDFLISVLNYCCVDSCFLFIKNLFCTVSINRCDGALVLYCCPLLRSAVVRPCILQASAGCLQLDSLLMVQFLLAFLVTAPALEIVV